ncbi:hypothetical protein EUGRSUZ_I00485, partial [Eucalyptus grandis]
MKLAGISFAEFPSCLVLLCIALALCFNQVSSTTNETDKLALLAFKAGITGDPFCVLNSWNNSIEFCQWYGVTCGRRHTRVTVLDLQSQGLSGSISPHIGNLSFLKEMRLQNNSLNHMLHLGGNNLGGSIPQVLGHLTNLQYISLGMNRLSGTIPPSLFNLSSLIDFWVGENQIQGTLPTSMGLKLPKLESFDVVDNQLEGPIPPSISNCTKLSALCVSLNGFSGKLPSFGNLYTFSLLAVWVNQLGNGQPEDLSFLCSLTNSTELVEVNIGENKFGGVLPKCLGNLSTTLKLFLTNMNQISGEIPEEIGNLVSLEVLFMNSNQLSGVIPLNLGNLQNLKMLQLCSNNLRGTIPFSLGNLTKMIQLDLSGNNFHGQIPSRLSNYRSLDGLDLSYNNLSGAIPPHLFRLSSLAILLCLSHNHLTGILPTEVGNLRALSKLDISDNLLVGEIPNSLGDCTSLASLRMEGNFFHGSIPQSIKSLGGIEELDLSRNNLSGQIPEFLAVFQSLKRLNLSYNKFEGMLPSEGIFKNAVGTSIVGNNELCGGLPKFHLPNCISKSHKSRKINIVIDNGTVVAVKVLHLVRRGALNSFIVECEALKNIKHRNLLKILTVCSSSDYQGNDFKALVYKFMDNGSLEQWLHSYATSSHGNMLPNKLNFIWRINIAIDVASALDYLHHQCHIPIIHCDLKPSNILLDAEMVAHMSSMGLRGTVGYAPPEYATGCEVSREGDVYSFGIMLLEIFTGLTPTDDKFRDNLTLHSFVAQALPERVLEITDNFLLHERESHLGSYSRRHWSSERDNTFQECLVMVYNIGVACSYQVPGIRMSINE